MSNPTKASEPQQKRNPRKGSEPVYESNPVIKSEPLDKRNPRMRSEPVKQSNPESVSEPSAKSNPRISSEPGKMRNPRKQSEPRKRRNPESDSEPYAFPEAEQRIKGGTIESLARLTIDDLTRLDNYGHKELAQLTEIELNEYATLLQRRRQEVLERIRGLRR